MNKKMKKIIILLIMMYLYLISFGGILTKFTVNNSKLLSIKQIFPDVILVIVIIIGIIVFIKQPLKKRAKLNLILIFYFTICLIIGYFNVSGSYMNTIYNIRDIYLPFVALIILYELNIYYEYKEKINKSLVRYATIATIGGFILGLIEMLKGYVWTSTFYAGYPFYGMNEKVNIMINYTINGVLRIPSITGSSVLFGFYSLICFLIILNLKKNGISKIIIVCLSIGDIMLSTNKTCLVLVGVILFISILRKINITAKIFLITLGIIICLAGVVYVESKTDLFNSIYIRINYTWVNVFNGIGIGNLVIPYNFFSVGAVVRNINNVKNYVDNSYIYIILTYGIGGILGYIYLYYYVIKNAKKNKNFMIQLVIVGVIAGVTISIFQARCYFTPYCLIVGLLQDCKKDRSDLNATSNIECKCN